MIVLRNRKKTHCIIIAGTDTFMSGWGQAEGGISYAGWACRPEERLRVLRWVKSRSDQKRVREVSGSWRPGGIGHTHIYVVEKDHNALK
jgi:hypothetical protein